MTQTPEPDDADGDGVGLVLAALNEDPLGMAHLLAGATPHGAMKMAAFSALLAARTITSLDHLTQQDTPSRLRTLAMELAATQPEQAALHHPPNTN